MEETSIGAEIGWWGNRFGDISDDLGKDLVINVAKHRTVGVSTFASVFFHGDNGETGKLVGLVVVGSSRDKPGISRDNLVRIGLGNLSGAGFTDDRPGRKRGSELNGLERARTTFDDSVHRVTGLLGGSGRDWLAKHLLRKGSKDSAGMGVNNFLNDGRAHKFTVVSGDVVDKEHLQRGNKIDALTKGVGSKLFDAEPAWMWSRGCTEARLRFRRDRTDSNRKIKGYLPANIHGMVVLEPGVDPSINANLGKNDVV